MNNLKNPPIRGHGSVGYNQIVFNKFLSDICFCFYDNIMLILIQHITRGRWYILVLCIEYKTRIKCLESLDSDQVDTWRERKGATSQLTSKPCWLETGVPLLTWINFDTSMDKLLHPS